MRSARPLLFVLVLGALASGFAACMPGHAARPIDPRARLAVGTESFVDDGPFRVVFAGPRGETTTPREVTISFSRPIRRLGPADDATSGPPPAAIMLAANHAAVEGTWRWFGDRTAVFWPAEPFANATEYGVNVDPHLHAFDGSALVDAAAPFTFVTQRPALTGVTYTYEEELDRHLVTVELNQSITSEEVAAAIRIEGRSAKGIQVVPFQVIDVFTDNRFRLHANRSIAALDDVTVIASAALRGEDGPLASSHETRLPLADVGAFHLEVTCGDAKVVPLRCAPDDGADVVLTSSKLVETKELLRHLVVSPPARLVTSQQQPEFTTSLSLRELLPLTPGRHHRVIVKAGLVATDHERLAFDQVLDFDMTDYPSAMWWRDLDRRATVVESARPNVTFELTTMNVPSFEAVRAPLDDATLFELLLGRPEAATAARLRALPGSTSTRTTVKSTKNEGAKTRFDLPATLRPSGTSGAFAVATSATGVADDVRVLSVTDLGISTKWSPHGALVWVKRLSSNAPVAGATISLRRAWRPSEDQENGAVTTAEAFVTRTDAQGFATIPPQVTATFLDTADARTEAILIASEGTDRAFSVLPPLDQELSRALAFVFTERALYRPGDTAYVKGIYRAPTAQGLVPLAGRVATVEALDDEQHVFFTKVVTLDAFGGFDCEMTIPRTVRLGHASVRTRLGTELVRTTNGGQARGRYGHFRDPWFAHTSFLVDELRPIEFKVDVAANADTFVHGDTARVTAHGRYLIGAPMHQIPVSFGVRRERTTFRPKGLEEFSTDASRLATHHDLSHVDSFEGTLQDDGSVTVPVPLVFPDQTGPEQVTVDAGIEDVSRAFIAGDDTRVLVHPSDTYLGLRTAAYQAWLGKTIRVELAAASITGERRPGIATRIVMLRIDEQSQPVETDVACDVRTTATIATCDLPVKETGPHWLSATAVDAKGRTLSAASAFDVPSGREPPPKPAPPPPPPPKPEPPPVFVSFDDACRARAKTDYRSLLIEGADRWESKLAVGQIAHGCMRGGPDTLLTLEREGILRRELRQLSGIGTLFDLLITPDFSPNVLVALTSVSGRSAPFPAGRIPRADLGHPSRSVSDTNLRVPAPDRKLTVTIETGSDHRPGDEVTTRIRVVDARGRPALSQVTFWAVDEGVYALRPFRIPELSQLFNDERRSDVIHVDTRDDIFWEKVGMHVARAPSLRQGATMTNGPAFMGRSVFRPTAWFLPNVVTGPDGVATVKAKLPDNLTTWKLFAVAMTASDGFGDGASELVANKPLMVRPQLPRFLRSGDHADATVIIDSFAKEAVSVKVTMRAFGSLATSGKLAEETLTIPPEGHVPVTFPLDAGQSGRGSIMFRASTTHGNASDEVTIDREVITPKAFETVVVSGESHARVDEPIGDLTRARSDVGGVDYKLAPTPIVGLAGSLEGLVEYPYGCTEQLTSRLVPLVRLRSLARELGVALPKDVDGSVRSSVASLLTHQRADGGFGFWPMSKRSEPALTVMALNALYASRAAGYRVAQEPIARALGYLETDQTLDTGARALLEDLLASPSGGGRPREKPLRELAALALKEPSFPGFARALVAHALAGVDRDLGLRVLASTTSQLRLTGATATFADDEHLPWRTHLSSDARTTAMTLRAYVALDPTNALVTKLVRGLLAMRRDGRWPTTQASAWALLALDEARPLYATSARGSTAHVLLDGNEIDRATFPAAASGVQLGATGTLSMQRLAMAPGATLSFTTEGGPLFYESALRFARRDPPKTPLEHGIYVTKTMRILRRGKEPAPTTDYRVGDYIEVDVMTTSPVARDLVVLDDPIPAGFEAVNETYANMDRQAMHNDPSTLVSHRELRDDRVVTFFDELPSGQHHTSYLLRVIAGGRFAVPPAKAECMYAPDVFGRTAASIVDARP